MRTIVVTDDCRIKSALLDHVDPPRSGARTLSLGDQLKTRRNLDLGYYGFVPSGEIATVVGLGPDGGYVDLMFNNQLDQLYDWANCLLLIPFDTQAWIDGLELVGSCLA